MLLAIFPSSGKIVWQFGADYAILKRVQGESQQTMSTEKIAAPYRRILLKLSGEALRAQGSRDNISPEIVARIAREIAEAQRKAELQIAIVVGGGNIWRGELAKVQRTGLRLSGIPLSLALFLRFQVLAPAGLPYSAAGRYRPRRRETPAAGRAFWGTEEGGAE